MVGDLLATNCDRRIAMGPRSRIIVGLFALVVFAGCASTKVSNRLVYDFVATPAEAAR